MFTLWKQQLNLVEITNRKNLNVADKLISDVLLINPNCDLLLLANRYCQNRDQN